MHPFAITILLLLFILNQQAFAESCVSTHFDKEVSIKKVIDGDTVILSDGRHIRLIGINTPEINHDNNKLSDKGAIKARSFLINLLDDHAQIQLTYGTERFDKHGRTLAHLYLKNDLNIQAELLRQGLAMPLRIAPNLSLVDCYNNAALSAKQKKLGLWTLSQYKTRNVSSLNGSEKGFYFISGTVERVSESRSSIWINLQNNVALRIHKDDLNYFNKNDLMSLHGETIEANGWLYKRNKQLRMRIRHRLDLKRLN
jgi:endonuclease YncB( thermonuclease family)